MKNEYRRLLATTVWIVILMIVFLCLGLSTKATGAFIGLLIGLPLALIGIIIKTLIKR
jgi:hypothetical protein